LAFSSAGNSITICKTPSFLTSCGILFFSYLYVVFHVEKSYMYGCEAKPNFLILSKIYY